jgi:hypothetical protein
VCVCVCVLIVQNVAIFRSTTNFLSFWRRHPIRLVDINFRSWRIKKKANCTQTLTHAMFQTISFLRKGPSCKCLQLLTVRLRLTRQCFPSRSTAQPLNYYTNVLIYFITRSEVIGKGQQIFSCSPKEGIQ